MISLEILNIYNIEKIINDKETEINKKSKIHLIKLNNSIKNYYNYKLFKFIDILKYTNLIHKIITKNVFHKMALSILLDYKKSNKSKITMQYIEKFRYIYFIKNEYYNNYKSLNYLYKINTDELINVSIINLYIIIKLKNKKGIYFLVKYLYS